MEEKKEQLLPNLSDAEIAEFEAKAELLAKKENISKVHPVVFIDPVSFERIVAYLREPNYETKIKVMDKSMTTGIFSAANELREACLLRNESNPLTYGETSECDTVKLGVTNYCLGLITRLENQFKKK